MRFGIIGAMEEEVKLLAPQVLQQQVHTIGHRDYITGTLGQHEVVLVQSGIGKVCAAASAVVLADHFKVDAIINTGCAGGIGAGLQIGDIVLSTALTYHDFDLRIFNYKLGQVPSYEPMFKGDQHLIDVAMKAGQCLKGNETFTPHIRTGVILSGDAFIADKQKCLNMLNEFPEAQATEMEGAAVGQICTDFDIPCLVIRSISDTAQNESNILYEQFVQLAADNSAKLVKAILENY